jgi:hypothetical protein
MTAIVAWSACRFLPSMVTRPMCCTLMAGTMQERILLLGEFVMVGSVAWLQAEGSFLTHGHRVRGMFNESTTSTYDLLNIAHDLGRKAVTRGINTHQPSRQTPYNKKPAPTAISKSKSRSCAYSSATHHFPTTTPTPSLHQTHQQPQYIRPPCPPPNPTQHPHEQSTGTSIIPPPITASSPHQIYQRPNYTRSRYHHPNPAQHRREKSLSPALPQIHHLYKAYRRAESLVSCKKSACRDSLTLVGMEMEELLTLWTLCLRKNRKSLDSSW